MPLSTLYEAAIKYEQLSGIDAAIAWHEAELVRLKACRSIVAARRAEVAVVDAAAPSIDVEWTDKAITALTDAVNFYARHDSYKGRKGDKPPVLSDGGARARETIGKVYGDEGNGGTE